MGPSEGLSPLPSSPKDDPCTSQLHAQSDCGSDRNPPELELVSATVDPSINFPGLPSLAWELQPTLQVTPPPTLLYPEGKQLSLLHLVITSHYSHYHCMTKIFTLM